MTRVARTQQMAIYAAEAGLPRGRRFVSLGEVQKFVDDLRDTWWWRTRYDRLVRVEVGPARSRRDSVGWYDAARGAGRIEIPPVARDVLTVTHELAHVIAEIYHRSRAHDPAFAREYANLTYLISGSEAWRALQAKFDEFGVDYL